MSRFALDVKAFCDRAKKDPEIVMRAVAIKLFSAIIKSSPVDTGRFRMNWQTSGATPKIGTVAGFDKSGSTAISSAQTFISNTQVWQEFTLTNNLPYAQRLEYGYSKQAPTGMVRTNVYRFNVLLAEEIARIKK